MPPKRITISETKIKACKSHADYMTLLKANGVNTHKAYYTEKGLFDNLVIVQKED